MVIKIDVDNKKEGQRGRRYKQRKNRGRITVKEEAQKGKPKEMEREKYIVKKLSRKILLTDKVKTDIIDKTKK